MSNRLLNPIVKVIPGLATFLLFFGLANLSLAESGTELLNTKCAQCHALTPVKSDLKERIARKGPPLHFAGNKYRREWLVEWLQKYSRINPAGIYPPAHTTVTDEGDTIKQESLTQSHPQLSKEEALLVADHLMTLKSKNDLVQKINYQPGETSKRKGMLQFTKTQGCIGCHQDQAENGGISAPELYTAWKRLQPNYIMSYIIDAVAWDENTMMSSYTLPENIEPDIQATVQRLQLKQKHIQRLADYLRLIAEEAEQ